MLRFVKKDDKGKSVTLYSHPSFLSQKQRDDIKKCYDRASDHSKFTAGILAIGLIVVKV